MDLFSTLTAKTVYFDVVYTVLYSMYSKYGLWIWDEQDPETEVAIIDFMLFLV